MLQALSSLKTFINSNRHSTESLVFYLHYRVTFLVLVFCCILISTQQFSGQRIQCLSKPSGEINGELMNSYCWAASTYSVSSSYLKEIGLHVPHPGVGSSEKVSEYEYRNFYQYVHITLFIQAILFYIPHLLWKSMERNLVNNLSDVINNCKTNTTPKDKSDCEWMDPIAIYMEDRWGNNRSLALKYLFCETLSAINVMAQSYLLDKFFHGKFLGLGLLLKVYYGSDVLSDPIRLFPLVTICNFHRYGASGYIDVIDSLCVLPNNAINAKVFLCIWVWFLVLLLFSICSLIHLLFCMIVPVYRILLPKSKSLFFNKVNNDSYIQLATAGNFGDWFVLSSIKKSMEELEFSRLMENLQSRISCFEAETKEP